MDREALVVGINRYPLLRDQHTKKLQHLEKPAADAEAIAQILEKYGNFRVRRLPEVYHQEGKRGVDPNPAPANLVTMTVLETAIAQLFNPPGRSIPDTALLFFAGHGLRKEQGGVTEGFLATSDAKPQGGQWGVSLRWLRELLQKSPVRQQIVWLDCCHSGELLNFDEVDPGNLGKALDRCLISACRDFEVSIEQLQGEHGILTAALLQSLDPERDVDGWVTNYKLAEFINKQMSAELQRPIFHNSGGTIILTDKTHGAQRQVDPSLKGMCPYKSLEYFTQEDAVFFYGRTALTDELIDKVRTENFIAVLGASGSGKSSVLRAGLLYQLKRGQKLSGSDRWKYYDPFTPGEHPLESLRNAIDKDAQELSQFIQTSPSNSDPPQPPLERGENSVKVPLFEGDLGGSPGSDPPQPPEDRGENSIKVPLFKGDLGGSPGLATSPTVETERVVLVIDQFEECFTMCQDKQERERFFACLLGAVEQSQNKLCLVLGMRADFLGRCAEYGELAHKIDQHLVTVKPMTRTEIEEAITKPAELVGLQVEKALVTKMTGDVVGSPGSLPLLQYTLTELWNQAQTGANRDRLQLDSYEVLGGIEGTLPKRANEVYQNLPPEQQPVAKRIFLELTQIGEISDSRRRVFLEDLINQQHSWQLLSEVKDQLVAARLITADAISIKDASNSQKQEQKVLVDIVHESLIRHWQELRQWVEKHQVALEIERRIESRARGWSSNGKIDDPGLLLKGATLTEAEVFLQEYGDLGLLDGVAEEYIKFSQDVRDREEEDKEKQIAELKRALTESKLREQTMRVLNWLSDKPTEALVLAIQTTGLYLDNFLKINQVYKGKETAKENELVCDIQNVLSESWEQARIATYFQAHNSVTYAAFSPDGKTIATRCEGSENSIVRLWNLQGQQITEFRGHQDHILCLAFSPADDLIATSSNDKSIRLWNLKGEQLSQIYYESPHPVKSIAFSFDGQTIATGSDDCTVRLWNLKSGALTQLWDCKTKFPVKSIAFSPNGKILVSGGSEIKIWDIEGNSLDAPLEELRGDMRLVSFRPENDELMFQILTICDRKAWLYDPMIIWLRNLEYYNVADDTPINCRTLLGLGDYLYCATFAPNKRKIVAGNCNGHILECDFDGYLIRQYYQEPKEINKWITSVAFSPDGQILLSSDTYGNIYLWDWSEQPSSGFLLATGNDKFSTVNNSHELISDTAPKISLLDYLKACCDRLRYHPVFKNPQTDVEKQACETCQKYVWSQEESKE